MSDGTPYDALITLKESVEQGHRIYSLELDEINKAALRWTVNDDGTLTPENEPSTGNLKKTITDNDAKHKLFASYRVYFYILTNITPITIFHCAVSSSVFGRSVS